jgi:hypothetical protein
LCAHCSPPIKLRKFLIKVLVTVIFINNFSKCSTLHRTQNASVNLNECLIVHNAEHIFPEVNQIVQKPLTALVVQLGDHRLQRFNVGRFGQVRVVLALVGTHQMSLAFFVALTPTFRHLPVGVVVHLSLVGELLAAAQELDEETDLQVHHLAGAHVEWQTDERQCWVIDADAVLPQRLDIVVLDEDTTVDRQEWECVPVAGAVENHRKRLLSSIGKSRPGFRQFSGVGFLSDIRLEVGFRWFRQVMAQRYTLRHLRNLMGQVHATRPGANHQHSFIWKK